jgi:hypothetical protein
MHGRKKIQKSIFSLQISFNGKWKGVPFYFVDRKSGFLFNIKKAELIKGGGTNFWGEFRMGRKGYPLILTRQLTP